MFKGGFQNPIVHKSYIYTHTHVRTRTNDCARAECKEAVSNHIRKYLKCCVGIGARNNTTQAWLICTAIKNSPCLSTGSCMPPCHKKPTHRWHARSHSDVIGQTNFNFIFSLYYMIDYMIELYD